MFLQFNCNSNGYTGRSSGRDAMEAFQYSFVLRVYKSCLGKRLIFIVIRRKDRSPLITTTTNLLVYED